MPNFHCFLSYNSADKSAVQRLKQALEAKGLRCWYDADELIPGRTCQPLMEQGIRGAASIAVCVGGDGLGPWQSEEMQAALQLAVRENRPVIPVLLPDAPLRPELPMFLTNRTWVDLSDGIDGAGLDQLKWPFRTRAKARTPTASGTSSSDSTAATAPGSNCSLAATATAFTATQSLPVTPE